MSAAAPKLTPGADAEAARYLSERVEARSGIHLPERKNELLLSRVTSRIMALGFPSITEYRRYLEALPADHEEWQALINELTTNKTDFFRESAHFEYLEKQFLPRWESEHGPGEKLNAWSAACSTGEEAYTLAMVLDRYFGQADRFHVLGSDVDTEALAFARNGVYPSARLEPVPDSFRERGIQFGKDALRGWGKIATPIYQRVSFEQLNLATERPRVAKGPFDVIFCRNVFIYFQRATIERAVASLYEAAAPGALLAIGHSENLQEIKNPWHSVGPALWEKTAGTKRASARKAEPVAAAQAAPKRVLIVDDSKTVTQLLRKVLSQDPSLEVVAEVNHPSEVEAAIRKYRPNVMTLDIHMPDMDGCEVLERILPTYPIPTVMISSISREEGPFVLRALELGAVDYIQKPSFNELDAIAPNLVRTVKGAAEARVKRPRAAAVTKNVAKKLHGAASFRKLIAIGSSTGGTEALRELLTQLPAEIPPILIVQHIPPVFSKAFADRINDLCPFEVKEAEDGDEVRSNRVLVAPGGRHMRLERTATGYRVGLSDAPPVNRHRPSVDVLFDSVSTEFGKDAIGVILTGMGADGAAGLLKMRENGSFTVAQDEESCVVFGMPKEAIQLGAAETVQPLGAMPALLRKKFGE